MQAKSKMVSLRDLAEYFWQIEQRYALNSWEVEGVKLWQYARFRIFNTYAQKMGVLAQLHTKKIGFFDLLKALPFLLYASIFHNPMWGREPLDTLIFNSGRKQKIGNRYVDIYLDAFINRGDFGQYMLIDELYNNTHLLKAGKRIKYQDYQMVRYAIKRYFIRVKDWEKQTVLIDKVEKDFSEYFNVNIRLKSLLYHMYKMYISDYQFFDKLLQRRTPKQIVMVCSYAYKKALIAVAKHHHVPTIEYQHGTISPYHMGYSYPNAAKGEIVYFPDELRLFGSYWQEAAVFPIAPKYLKVVGFPYFHVNSRRFKLCPQPGHILLISQGSIGERLSHLMWQAREQLKNYQLIYKLHPGEYTDWQHKYPQLKTLANYPNVKVVDHSHTPIYQYFAKSDLVLGVYSTAVFEALAFGCKAALIDLPGVEYFDHLIHKGILGKFSHPADAIQSYENNTFPLLTNKHVFFGQDDDSFLF